MQLISFYKTLFELASIYLRDYHQNKRTPVDEATFIVIFPRRVLRRFHDRLLRVFPLLRLADARGRLPLQDRLPVLVHLQLHDHHLRPTDNRTRQATQDQQTTGPVRLRRTNRQPDPSSYAGPTDNRTRQAMQDQQTTGPVKLCRTNRQPDPSSYAGPTDNRTRQATQDQQTTGPVKLRRTSGAISVPLTYNNTVLWTGQSYSLTLLKTCCRKCLISIMLSALTTK